MGYTDAEAGSSFRLMYVYQGWALIVDADRPDGCEAGTWSYDAPKPTGKVYEDRDDYLAIFQKTWSLMLNARTAQ